MGYRYSFEREAGRSSQSRWLRRLAGRSYSSRIWSHGDSLPIPTVCHRHPIQRQAPQPHAAVAHAPGQGAASVDSTRQSLPLMVVPGIRRSLRNLELGGTREPGEPEEPGTWRNPGTRGPENPKNRHGGEKGTRKWGKWGKPGYKGNRVRKETGEPGNPVTRKPGNGGNLLHLRGRRVNHGGGAAGGGGAAVPLPVYHRIQQKSHSVTGRPAPGASGSYLMITE